MWWLCCHSVNSILPFIVLLLAVTNQVKAVLFLLIVWLVGSLDGLVCNVVWCFEGKRVRTKTYSPSWYEWYRRPFCGEGGLVGVRPGFLEVKYLISKTLARELVRQ
jgi:hypothetical protein